MQNRAIKYRIYPTAEQAVLFEQTIGCCRKLWNLMLADKIEHYKKTGEMLYVKPSQYKADHPYLKECDSLAYANVWTNLNTAYKNFFRAPRVGFPKFKSKKYARHSYTTSCVNGNITILDNAIKLPKVGIVKAKIHREPHENWKLKSVTISHDADGSWYAAVLFEYKVNAEGREGPLGDKVNAEGRQGEFAAPAAKRRYPGVEGALGHEATVSTLKLNMDNSIGLDYKSDGLYAASDGTIGSRHKHYRESQDRLAKEQRRLSRKVPGSKNYEKQKRKVAKIHKHIANQRKDHLHKLSTEIANRYDVICVEDLNMRNMANRGFHNGKATMDNGYGMFLNMLAYKQADRGHMLIKVDKWYPSSQLCCKCGSRHKLLLSERIYHCPECGNVMDRDLNAAINIKAEGLRMLVEVA